MARHCAAANRAVETVVWEAGILACSICTRFECHCQGANCQRLHAPSATHHAFAFINISTYFNELYAFNSKPRRKVYL